jgi:hypothetical protein
MITITVWLLLSTAQYSRPAQVIERFPTQADCEHVQRAHAAASPRGDIVICVQAKVLR